MKRKPTKKVKSSESAKVKRVPYSYKPEDMDLSEWQTALRKQYAIEQNFIIENIGTHPVFSDYSVFNPKTAKLYKVAIRDDNFGLNFCSCPDFKTNMLGTCKHIEFVLYKLKSSKKNDKFFKKGYQPEYSSVSLRYGLERKVFLRIGSKNNEEIQKLAGDYFDKNDLLKEESFYSFETFIDKVKSLDPDFRCYRDAEDFIICKRSENKRKQIIDKKYLNGNFENAFEEFINTKLYPYQKEGVLFAAKAGRCLIADEMGLGKTIQAIAAAELMNREFGVEKVLIVCPTSLKYQWKTEIKKFTGKEAMIIEGMAAKRQQMYQQETFYKIISYNVIKSDLQDINKYSPDLIILDEAQRIKNWKTKTAQNVKSLSSEHTIVLTGTPLENRLDELHSIIQFIDMFRLGPLFRFLHNHQITDNAGKVTGYTNLHQINQTLKPVLIRRNKSEVQLQLPERIDKNYFVPVTKEQMILHADYDEGVARLVAKWRRFKYLSEPDRQKLLIFLNCMRMVSDSTYILDQETRNDVKIDELMIVLNEIFENKEEKVVIFSQWERMTRLVAQELELLNVNFEYLHGGIPSNKRGQLLENFHNKPECRVFLSTDAGGVGLNLQSASTIINLDIPWNPAVLEQRIARVHRIGQKNYVRVINFVSAGTIEEKILALLGFKKSVFEGVLDHGDDQVFMGEDRFKQFMHSVETLTDTPLEEQEAVMTEEETRNEKDVNKETEAPTSEAIEEIETIEEEEPAMITGTEKPAHDADYRQESKNISSENIQDLVMTGINFLQKLSSSLTDGASGKGSTASFIEKDEHTGKQYFKVPVPDEQVVSKFVNALGAFMQAFTK